MDILANYDSDEDECITEQKIEESEENIFKTAELNHKVHKASSLSKFLIFPLGTFFKVCAHEFKMSFFTQKILQKHHEQPQLRKRKGVNLIFPFYPAKS